jgi:DNA-binding transcriptional LysR family regulator
MILEYRCDVGFVINPEPHADLVIKELAQDEVRIWKKKGSKNSDILLVDENLFQTQTLLERLRKKNIRYPRLVRSSNLEVLASLLETGMGHVILPERVARQVGVAFEEAHPEIPPFKDTLSLVYRPNFRKNALGKAFIAAVAEQEF